MYKILFILLFSNVLQAQFKLNGTVKSQNVAIENAVVTLGKNSAITSTNGTFLIDNLKSGIYTLKIQHVGYEDYEQTIHLIQNETLTINLKQKIENLQEVIIKDVVQKIDKTMVNHTYISNNNQGSLMKSLENLPGINAVGVGTQASKPVVRGMSFTRVAVVENGIKHEGQQWGADHGLEIESNQVESIELLKGVDAMLYGSDAVGGVLKINSNKKPNQLGFSGNFETVGKSINNSINGALNLDYSSKNWFVKFKTSLTDFGDYSIPTDQIIYLNQIVPIENQKLKNTAGNEQNYALQVGFQKRNFSSTWSASWYKFKMGFFPAAHGAPTVSKAKDDGDSRNIDFPRQEVSHVKILGNNSWKWNKNSIEILTSFQRNLRKELSFFHSHYPTQPIPLRNPELELNFDLKTFDAQTFFLNKNEKNSFTFGASLQLQQNVIDGYQFLLPNYQRNVYSTYSSYQNQWNSKWHTKLGVRFDYGNYTINRYFDSNFFTYLKNSGTPDSNAIELATRSKGLDKNFKAFNWGITNTYEFKENQKITYHLGSVFRFPSVMELSANGIHHGSFRHEKGDENLDIEKGYQTELSYYFKKQSHELNVNLYLFYFQNYLFLKPSGFFSVLPHAGQTYQYTQSKALLGGIELQWKTYWNNWQSNLVLEYLQNKELTQDFGLPFSPAPNGFWEIDYLLKDHKYFENTKLQISVKHSLEQRNIAQNEDFTNSWTILNLGISSEIKLFKIKIYSSINIYNLMNTKYYNHTSFYRPLEIPEQGRNIVLKLRITY
ncbi:MAG: TonB-dependent receptor [Flavobacterium sp.]